MQRDLDLIRTILLDIEATPADQTWSTEQKSYDRHVLLGHMLILSDAGFIEGSITRLMNGTGAYGRIRLTWLGHEFIASTKNPKIWEKVKEKLADESFSFMVPAILGWIQDSLKASV